MLRVGARRAGRSRAALAAVALLGAACASGCHKRAAAPPPRSPLELGLLREGGPGPAVGLIPLDSGEAVRLSLWIDAGARDADPAQVAVLAAWLAAEAAGPGVEAQVLPDGTELALDCPRAELAACLRRLQRGLALRAAPPARVSALRNRLVAARRAAEAHNPAREAERLAIAALFGGDAGSGLFPLGRAEEDAELGAERVAAFLAEHFGPRRALVIAAGALEPDALVDAVAAAFPPAPVAKRARAAERPSPGEGGVAVEISAESRLALAIAAPGLPEAQAAAAALRSALERDPELALRAPIRGHVFAVRGAALALLRVETRALERAVGSAAQELERLRVEGLPGATARAAGADPRALTHKLGMRWIARGAGTATALALGAGALVAGGRADAVELADPDAAARDAARERLAAAFDAGRERVAPKVRGDIEDERADVTLDNGARLALRARAADHVAVAVRFARGAAFEPPTLHGRSALLATLLATACAGLSPEQLEERLRALGADLQPRADADSFGIALVAPARHWREAVALALECALQPGLERRHLSTARLRLLARLGGEGGAGELSTAAAEVVWPSAPGAVAPWGNPARQAAISLASLRELYRECRRGTALAVAISGALPVADALPWAARRLAALEGGEPKAAGPAAPSATQHRARVDQPTLALALWRVPDETGDATGARAFAALARAAATAFPGVSASWHDAGSTSGGAWAAVALSGAPESLAAAAAALPGTVRALASDALARAVDRAFELAELAKSAQAASPLAEAETLARAPFRAQVKPASREQARALAARLAAASPEWLPLR